VILVRPAAPFFPTTAVAVEGRFGLIQLCGLLRDGKVSTSDIWRSRRSSSWRASQRLEQ